jgi:zinc transporter 13
LIFGIIAFLFIEKIFDHTSDPNKTTKESKKIVGYLNLLANCIDNFIHGLAVASSFLTSFKLGLTTVFAILIHEIPHEIGDFAILLNSGFSRYIIIH